MPLNLVALSITRLEMEVGRKYIKVWSYLVNGGEET